MRCCNWIRYATLILILLISGKTTAQQQDWLGDFRISFYGTGSSISDHEERSSFSELVTGISFHSPYNAEQQGLEYAVDFRSAAYPGTEERDTRLSLYNAYVGYGAGKFNVKAGQMWLNELGALGSIGGAVAQYRGPKTSAGSLRFGGFGGKEPDILDLGYVSNVTKYGGYFAVDGENGRSHILSFVQIQNQGFTERSVIVFNNYIPVANEFFLYQLGEYDLVGPANLNDGSGLNYFFVNGRYAPRSRLIEVQGTFHNGRSIDARSITEDQINGRPIPPTALDGFLFESTNFRVTAKTVHNLFVFGGAGSDRNNREENRTNRFTYGFYTPELLQTGVDLNFTGIHYAPPEGNSYESWSFSAGRNIGEKLYLSGNYYSSGSVIRFTTDEQIVLEQGPRTDFFTISALIYATRSFSFLATLDYTTSEAYTETRFLGGVTYRFQRK